jgi:hypothetical protein
VDKSEKVEIAEAGHAGRAPFLHIESETQASKLHQAGKVGNAGKQWVENVENVGFG